MPVSSFWCRTIVFQCSSDPMLMLSSLRRLSVYPMTCFSFISFSYYSGLFSCLPYIGRNFINTFTPPTFFLPKLQTHLVLFSPWALQSCRITYTSMYSIKKSITWQHLFQVCFSSSCQWSWSLLFVTLLHFWPSGKKLTIMLSFAPFPFSPLLLLTSVWLLCILHVWRKRFWDDLWKVDPNFLC